MIDGLVLRHIYIFCHRTADETPCLLWVTRCRVVHFVWNSLVEWPCQPLHSVLTNSRWVRRSWFIRRFEFIPIHAATLWTQSEQLRICWTLFATFVKSCFLGSRHGPFHSSNSKKIRFDSASANEITRKHGVVGVRNVGIDWRERCWGWFCGRWSGCGRGRWRWRWFSRTSPLDKDDAIVTLKLVRVAGVLFDNHALSLYHLFGGLFDPRLRFGLGLGKPACWLRLGFWWLRLGFWRRWWLWLWRWSVGVDVLARFLHSLQFSLHSNCLGLSPNFQCALTGLGKFHHPIFSHGFFIHLWFVF